MYTYMYILCIYDNRHMVLRCPKISKADPAPAHLAHAPCTCLKFFKDIIENLDNITRINFILINMQRLQCVFYSLLSLIKHSVCVKGH